MNCLKLPVKSLALLIKSPKQYMFTLGENIVNGTNGWSKNKIISLRRTLLSKRPKGWSKTRYSFVY